jgi:hypothetical protein
MKKIIVFLLLLGSVIEGSAQTIFKNESYGFSMEQPKDWFVGDKKMLTENLNKFDIDEEALGNAIKSNNGSLLLATFYKYDPKQHAGIIPTIQINVRLNPTKTFEQFHIAISQSAMSIKKIFPDFALINDSHTEEVSGIKSSTFTGTYTLTIKEGKSSKVRVRNYAIPYGKYFFQVSFIDEFGGEDASKTYDALLPTIRIGK